MVQGFQGGYWENGKSNGNYYNGKENGNYYSISEMQWRRLRGGGLHFFSVFAHPAGACACEFETNIVRSVRCRL